MKTYKLKVYDTVVRVPVMKDKNGLPLTTYRHFPVKYRTAFFDKKSEVEMVILAPSRPYHGFYAIAKSKELAHALLMQMIAKKCPVGTELPPVPDW